MKIKFTQAKTNYKQHSQVFIQKIFQNGHSVNRVCFFLLAGYLSETPKQPYYYYQHDFFIG